MRNIQLLLEEINKARGEVEDTILITRFGRKFEQEFLGFTLPDETDLYFEANEYLSFQSALEEMKNTQPEGYDPCNPSEGCNEEFFEAVRSFLPWGKEDLSYFISVGTRMDFFHGVDAVFSWKGVIATIDVTVDPKKKCKADFCIFPADVESGKVYDTIASNIAFKLLSRYMEKDAS